MTEMPGAGVDAKLTLDLTAAIGGMTQQIKLLRSESAEERRQASYARLKNYLPLTAAVTLNASGIGFVDFGTPMFGRVWTVRLLTAAVQGGELAANAAANIGWYIGTTVPSGTVGTVTPFTSQWRDSAAGVPVVKTYTSDIHQVRMGEHLFVIVNGPVGQANANMVFNAVVLDEPMKVGIPASVQG